MGDYELIKAWVNNGRGLFCDKNTKATAHEIYCCNKDNCQLYKNKQCLMLSIWACRCPYGKRNIHTGYTRRARRYHLWISKHEEKYKDKINDIKEPPKMLNVIGDYVHLPYPYIDGGFANRKLTEDVEFYNKTTNDAIIKKKISL